MNYCDCGDYCGWCHPEMCGPSYAKPTKGYSAPDVLAHVYAFALTEAMAREIADDANYYGVTRKGKFVAGSFQVAEISGRLPAVVGLLTGE